MSESRKVQHISLSDASKMGPRHREISRFQFSPRMRCCWSYTNQRALILRSPRLVTRCTLLREVTGTSSMASCVTLLAWVHFIFVPAGQQHRFEDFSKHFAVWVFFFGPEGGEATQTEARRSV